jgi:murein L,D-transpeptidase YafK
MLLAFKQERRMEVWGMGVGRWHLIATYRILAASGRPGPKLKEGDRQVPEGIYPITALNAASHYHLALKVGYPNTEDLQQAAIDGRTDLGGDIMIHGSEVSAGCLAMGDSAIEEIFALVDEVGIDNTQVLIAPHDMRRFPSVADPRPWVLARYAEMAQVLQQFTRP